jgi:hypothetical protein
MRSGLKLVTVRLILTITKPTNAIIWLADKNSIITWAYCWPQPSFDIVMDDVIWFSIVFSNYVTHNSNRTWIIYVKENSNNAIQCISLKCYNARRRTCLSTYHSRHDVNILRYVKQFYFNIRQYPRRPTHSGTVPLFEEQFQKSGTVPNFSDHVIQKRNGFTKSGTGAVSGSQFHKETDTPQSLLSRQEWGILTFHAFCHYYILEIYIPWCIHYRYIDW